MERVNARIGAWWWRGKDVWDAIHFWFCVGLRSNFPVKQAIITGGP